MLRDEGGVTAQRVLTLYGRAGCGLCAEAALWLRGWADELRFSIEERDIDQDPVLLAAYDWLVPVVKVGEVELGRAPLDKTTLRQRLRALLDR